MGQLPHGLQAERRVDLAIVGHELAHHFKVGIAPGHQRAYAARVIHGLVFQRREAIVKHRVGHVNIVCLVFNAVQLVVGQFYVGAPLLTRLDRLCQGILYLADNGL